MGRICRRLIRLWFALFFRKIRLLRARDVIEEGPALLAVSHPASFLDALILTTACSRPTHCLVPRKLAASPIARFLAGALGMILTDDDGPIAERELQTAMKVLAKGGALVVFASQGPKPHAAPGAFASTAAFLAGKAESQLAGRAVVVHPVHLFLPVASSQSRELLIYIDSALSCPAPGQEHNDGSAWVTALEARFQENAFRLRPAELEYFLADLEKVLCVSLKEDWSSRPHWKQDTEGFVLSRFVADWAGQTNYLNPGRLVTLRQSLEDYRRHEQQRALRWFEVEAADSWIHSGLRRTIVWLETLVGLPVALYGLANHLVIGAGALLAGSFRKDSSRDPTAEWVIRGAILAVGYAVQIYLVAHRWGRAAAGYYAPSLPVSGLYLWRYAWLLQHQTRLLFSSLMIPASTRKAKRVRDAFLEEFEEAVGK